MNDLDEPSDAELSPEAAELMAFVEDVVLNSGKLFDGPGERLGLIHDFLGRRAKRWAKPQLCGYRGCSNRSVIHSHALQRAGPLQVIAEDSTVLTPEWTPSGHRMKPLGLAKASTFAGFCEAHERLFEGFEAKRAIETMSELGLQVFRSICREIANQRRDIQSAEEAIAQMSARLDAEIRKKAARLGVGLREYSFDYGPVQQLRQSLAESRQALAWLEGAYDDHFPAVDGAQPTALVGDAFQADLPFPIALSGIGYFDFEGIEVCALLGVLPQLDGTLIYMLGRAGSEAAIGHYLRAKSMNLPLIDIVETWLLRGSNHWFIRPSAWGAIPEARRAALLKLIDDSGQWIGETATVSVFDELRQKALSAPMSKFGGPAMQAYAARQRAKLD